ncbi:MAG TPA: DNA/RNA nuclease SfsA, partial [Xanthobacteraceae bacterium]|nr:DNA/RNA nuclease SfsA [Xanthobacteraceae bacterium]
RKLAYSWELVETDFGGGPELVGVNTSHPNTIIAEALAARAIADFAQYSMVRREVRYGKNSRVDFLLEGEKLAPCYLEVKNVHMMRAPGCAEFPDAVTARGAKHLDELSAVAKSGARAALLFLVQIGSAQSVSLAEDIDPAYKAAFDRALAAGVEAFALTCRVSFEGIEIGGAVPVLG